MSRLALALILVITSTTAPPALVLRGYPKQPRVSEEKQEVLTQEVADAIRSLGADSFQVREQAQRKLLKIGIPALDQLRSATNLKDPEVVRRAHIIVGEIRERAASEEMSRLAGTWELLTLIKEGELRSLPNVTLAIKEGTVFAIRDGNMAVALATINIDPSVTPKAITLVYEVIPYEGQTACGIYELRAQTLRWCCSFPEGRRPKHFTSSPGSGQYIEVFRRVPN